MTDKIYLEQIEFHINSLKANMEAYKKAIITNESSSGKNRYI